MATIIAPPALSCTTGDIEDVSCFGANDGSVQVTGIGGSGALLYGVSGVGTNQTGLFENLGPGVYTASVSDLSGCISECDFTIVSPSLLTCEVAVTVNVSCEGGSDGTVLASGDGGAGLYIYSLGSEQNSSGIFSDLR